MPDYNVLLAIRLYAYDPSDGYELLLQAGAHQGPPLYADGRDESIRRHRLLFQALLRGLSICRPASEKRKQHLQQGQLHRQGSKAKHLDKLFQTFEDMQTFRHTKPLGIIWVDESVWKRLSKEGKTEMEKTCGKIELLSSELMAVDAVGRKPVLSSTRPRAETR